MILAAGLGTRLRPLTDRMPKALVPFGGTPLLERLIVRLRDAGYGRFVVNVHHFPEQIEAFLREKENFGCRIDLSDERDLLRETGGAIRHASPLLADAAQGRFLVHNVDIVTDLDYAVFTAAADEFLSGTPSAGAVLAVSDRPSRRYLLFDRQMRLAGWTNLDTGEVRSPYDHLDPAACRKFAFSGISMLPTALLPQMAAWPERFSLIDFFLQNCRRSAIFGIDCTGVSIRDVGKLKELEDRV